MQEKDANDCKHEYLHIQCKHSKRNAMVNLWDKAKDKTKKTGEIPILALGVQGRRGFWVLCKASDLQAVAAIRERAVKSP